MVRLVLQPRRPGAVRESARPRHHAGDHRPLGQRHALTRPGENTMMKTILASAVLAALAGPALAISFEGSLTQGATTVTDYSGTGLISFDVDWANLAPV